VNSDLIRKENFIYRYWPYLLVVCLALSRFLFLDMDTPSLFVSNLCAEDEAYYCSTGIEKFLLDDNATAKSIYTKEYIGISLYSHYPVYLSMKLLGNNFWALRLFPVLLSILVSLLIVDSLKRLLANKILLLLGVLLIGFDFTLFMFGRYNGPQIYSIAALAFLLWLFVRYGAESKGNLFLLGFMAFFSVSVIYVYNSYVLGAFGLYFFILSIKERKLRYLIFYSFGVLSAGLFFLMLLYFSNSSIQDIVGVMENHGGGVKTDSSISESVFGFISNSVKLNLKRTLSSFVNNSVFTYNNVLLLLFSFSIGSYFVNKKQQNPIIMLSVIIIGMAFLQNIFAQSYPIKKLSVLLPVIILFSLSTIDRMFSNRELILASLKPRLILFSFLFFGLIAVSFNYRTVNNANFYSFYVKLFGEFTPMNKSLMTIQFSIAILVFVLLSIAIFKNNVNVVKWLSVGVIPSIIFISYSVSVERTYLIRDALIQENKHLKGKHITGDFGYYFQFYTGAVPFYNFYNLHQNHPGEMERMDDSLFKSQQEVYRMDKVILGNNIAERTEGDTILMNGDKKFLLLAKHPITNYDYFLLKRVE
jgi:hypothetical protein